MKSSVATPGLDGRQTGKRREANPADQREVLRKKMMATGERLIHALDLENKLTRLIAEQPVDEEIIAQWATCRDRVQVLAEAYLAAIASHRRASAPGLQPIQLA